MSLQSLTDERRRRGIVLLQICSESRFEVVKRRKGEGFELAKRSQKALKILFLGVNGASNSCAPCALQTDVLLVKLRRQASVGETRFRKVVKDG